ncbi:MAG TPA: T9SS type A sorting domain-containing protein [Candidatus Kapabacteria bacterium]|nr:T9SS type A sorting domain-containing protein [Candidatus Kapabacteria bacterium]
MKRIFFVIFFLASWCRLFSQPSIDTQGKDFWFAFIPNYHNIESEGYNKAYYTDTLYIFIVAYDTCSGTISYRDYSGKSYNQNFTISDPNKIYTLRLNYEPYELEGFNRSGTIVTNSQDEAIAKQSFHITTTNDVTVYAHSQAITTSESMTALPTDALGTEYLILAYNSDGSYDSYSYQIGGQSTPSQFAIVATQDSTNVTIVPSVPTRKNKSQTQNITLNQGDVYLVQADIIVNKLRNDLTGSKVSSNKPIAIIAGQQRTTLPINGVGTSRDMLMEQLPPLNAWGRNSIVTPFAQSSTIENKSDNDLFRVLAYSDNTQLYIDGELITTLNNGQFFESYLDSPHSIEASAPILVAQYKKSSQAGFGGGSNGDPLMLIIPPEQQYGNFYRFANIQAYEYDFQVTRTYKKVYTEHYLNIISQNNTLNNIKLDGNLVQPSAFQVVPNSNYSYAVITVNEGTHEVSCPGGCGIIVYGYGMANSYGYYGGMNLIRYDFTSPKLYASNGCYTIYGIVTDSSISDSKIVQLEFPISNQENVNITANNTFPTGVASYSATLINHYLDGSFKIRATDSAGLYTEIDYNIPGFTIALKDVKESTLVPEIIDTILSGNKKCFDLTIENYGKFPHQINHLLVKYANSIDTIPDYNGVIFQQGEQRTFQYCFTPSDSGNFIFDVIIEDSCDTRQIAKLNLYALRDVNPPSVQANIDSCQINYVYDVYETLKSDGGISNAQLIKGINIDFQKTVIDKKHYQLKITILDPRQDAYFKIEIVDSAGNKSTIEVVRPGFTLEFITNKPSNTIDFGLRIIGGLYVDTLKIYNYGSYPITIDQAFLQYYMHFGIPQSQFPLVINPKDTTLFVIAYKPVYVKDHNDYDNLIFTLNCITETIPIIGFAREFNINASSRCDVNIRFITDSIPTSLEVTLADEYSKGGIIQLSLRNPKNSNIDVSLYNSLGMMVEKLYSGPIQKGETTLNIKMNNYSAGVYFIILDDNGTKYLRRFLKIE